MSIKDLFHLPRYISTLEQKIEGLEIHKLMAQETMKSQNDRLSDLEKELKLFEGKLQVLEKYFTSKPVKNQIEEKEIEEIEVDESFRIPIVDGIKVKFEGEEDDLARPLNIKRAGVN